MGRRRKFLALVVTLVLAACATTPGPNGAPSHDIGSLAAEALPGATFLPPLGRPGGPLADFDPDLPLAVELFRLGSDGTGGSPLGPSFTTADGSLRIVDAEGEGHYQAQWNTRDSELPVGTRVRIEVRLPQAPDGAPACQDGASLTNGCLAFTDVQLVANKGKLAGANGNGGGLIDLVNGQTLPIRLHVKRGAASPPPGEVARIEITPDAVLLARQRETHALSARAFDSHGNLVAAAFSWSSSNPAVVRVDRNGRVTAEAGRGSAQIVAEAHGVRSAPAMAVVAEPAAGAVLLDDRQVVGLPSPVDPDAEPGVGERYRVTLTGAGNLTPGTVLLAREGAPIAGRIVTVQRDGGKLEVVYETVPLTELVENLVLDEVYDLRQAEVVVNPEIAASSSVHRAPDGTLSLQFRPQALAPQAGGELEFELGPFECKLSSEASLDLAELVTIHIENVLKVPITIEVADGELVRAQFVLQGAVMGTLTGGPKFSAEFESLLTCRAEFATVKVPIGGFLSAVIAPLVPLGMGFDVDGKVQAPTFQAQLVGKAGVGLELGFDYQNGSFERFDEFTVHRELKPVLNWPQGDEFRLAAGAYFYGWADLVIGSPILEAWSSDPPRLEILAAAFGPRMDLEAAAARVQAVDPGYAARYGLKLLGQAGLGGDLQALFDKLGGGAVSFDLGLTLDLPLASSPTGTLTTDKQEAAPDEPVALTVALDASKLDFPLIGYNLDEVVFYRLRNDQLEEMKVLQAAPGQSQFTWTWTPTTEDAGENTFVAFVTSLGLPLVPLEVALDSSARVTVASELELAATPTEGDAPLAVAFSWTGLPGSGATCSLDPGDGTPEYTIDPCTNDGTQGHTYASGGAHTATLTALRGGAAIGTATTQVAVREACGSGGALCPSDIERLMQVEAWDIEFSYSETTTAEGAGDRLVGGNWNWLSWSYQESYENAYSVRATVADCQFPYPCALQYPAELSGVTNRRLKRTDAILDPDACDPDDVPSALVLTSSETLTPLELIDRGGHGINLRVFNVDFSVNPPVAYLAGTLVLPAERRYTVNNAGGCKDITFEDETLSHPVEGYGFAFPWYPEDAPVRVEGAGFIIQGVLDETSTPASLCAFESAAGCHGEATFQTRWVVEWTARSRSAP